MRFVAAAAAIFAVSGCVATQDVFAKSGITQDRYERDAAECSTRAMQSTPANTQLGYSPLVGIYTADVNAQTRAVNAQICMRDKGYSKITVPVCTGKAMTEAFARVRTEAARGDVIKIGSDTCMIGGQSGLPYFSRQSAE